MRIAIVHDKLWQVGGGERVALAMRGVWPDADLYTSTYDPALTDGHAFGEVHATFLQRAPRLNIANHYFLPLYDAAFRRLDLSAYDVVVSSAAMFAKSVRPPASVPHLCYCHTPVRFLWDLRESAVAELPRSAPVRAIVSGTARWLRRVDHLAASRVTRFVANSTHVAKRIERYYGRESTVIHPPVDIETYRDEVAKEDYLLVVARLFPYKRVDLAIQACNRLGLPLKIVGEGSDRPRLENLAGPTIEFCGWVPEAEKRRLVGAARALLAPQVEDFGIASVEAIAAGTPVLALRDGGALDIVREGLNGSFFEAQNAEALEDAIRSFDPRAFDRQKMMESAERFSGARFAREIRAAVGDLVRA